MVRGSIWTIGLRWSMRFAGVVSTIILARLLTPADFGIVAIAMLVVGTIEVFGQTGQRLALIRHEAPTRQHYDAAWTISLIVGFALAVTILLLAPFTQSYFQEPAAIVVMQALALRALIGGAENIGVVEFRRNLRFDRVFQFGMIAKATSFCVTIALAVWLRNYWALVCGILAGQLASNLASYAMHPFRPRIDFTKVPEIWSFSAWTLVKSVGAHMNANVDALAIGGFSGASAMGRYTVASDIASSPTNEINDPMISVMFPVMAKAQGDPEEVRKLYLRVLGWSAIICSSTAVGMSVVAEDFVALVLGPQWDDVAPLVPWLALAAGVLGLSSGTYSTLDVLGHPRRSAQLQLVRLVCLASVLIPVGGYFRELEPVAVARLLVIVAFMPALFFQVGRFLEVSAAAYVAAFWKPFVSAGAMAVVVVGVNLAVPDAGVFRLALGVLAGVASYTGCLVFLWSITGRADGPEREFFEYAQRLVQRVRSQG